MKLNQEPIRLRVEDNIIIVFILMFIYFISCSTKKIQLNYKVANKESILLIDSAKQKELEIELIDLYVFKKDFFSNLTIQYLVKFENNDDTLSFIDINYQQNRYCADIYSQNFYIHYIENFTELRKISSFNKRYSILKNGRIEYSKYKSYNTVLGCFGCFGE